MALTKTVACRSAMRRLVAWSNAVPWPALAMTTSSFWMLWVDCRSFTAVAASVSLALSILTMISWLPSPFGRSPRDLEPSLSGSRTAAMTVVFGRKR